MENYILPAQRVPWGLASPVILSVCSSLSVWLPSSLRDFGPVPSVWDSTSWPRDCSLVPSHLLSLHSDATHTECSIEPHVPKLQSVTSFWFGFSDTFFVLSFLFYFVVP